MNQNQSTQEKEQPGWRVGVIIVGSMLGIILLVFLVKIFLN